MHFSTLINVSLLASAALALPVVELKGEPLQAETDSFEDVLSVIEGRAAAKDYPTTVLAHHNIHRKNHSTPYLLYNNNLASYAQTVANSCKFAHDLTPGGGGYGQNIAVSASSASNYGTLSPITFAAISISNQWYNGEVNSFLPSYYGQANPPNFSSWGHFSQVVWKATTSVGCATTYCPAGTIYPAPFNSWFTVCNYASAGNVGGQYGTNILKSIGNPTVSA